MRNDECPYCRSLNPMGVKIQGVYDGILFWHCLACGKRWHRFGPEHPLRRRAENYINGPEQLPPGGRPE